MEPRCFLSKPTNIQSPRFKEKIERKRAIAIKLLNCSFHVLVVSYLLLFFFLGVIHIPLPFLLNWACFLYFNKLGWLASFFLVGGFPLKKKIWVSFFNKGIWTNLYKFYFLSSNFFSQPNKKVFHPSCFSTLPTKY